MTSLSPPSTRRRPATIDRFILFEQVCECGRVGSVNAWSVCQLASKTHMHEHLCEAAPIEITILIRGAAHNFAGSARDGV